MRSSPPETRAAESSSCPRNRPQEWPEGERGSNLLALARGQFALKKIQAAEETAARVPDDGTLPAYEARLFRCDLVVARLGAGRKGAVLRR